MTAFSEWVDEEARKLGDETDADRGRRFGVPQSTVKRWRQATEPPSRDTLRKIAGGLGKAMPEVLIQAGFMTREEAGIREVEVRRQLTNAELADEVRLRLVGNDGEGRPRNPRGTTAPKRAAERARGLQDERQSR